MIYINQNHMIVFGKLLRQRFSIKTYNKTYKLFCSETKKQNDSKSNDALIKRQQEVRLMEDTYEKVKMKGLHGRDITGVDDFQRDILNQNKFDLLNPKIEPKMASVNTTLGLEIDSKNYLAQINLGKIKVKKQNQVFLSEVDPYNIPQYYNIVFDYEKEMSLVGKKIEGTKGLQSDKQKIQSAQMKISTQKAFQQKSERQLMKQTFGVELDFILNSRIVWKHLLIAIFIAIFLTTPFLDPILQYYQCLQSINQIQEERIKQMRKIRQQALINAMINNPDMHIQ